jgi:hypothetical protein
MRNLQLGRRVRTWSLPAVAYWISGPWNDPDRWDHRWPKAASTGSARDRTVAPASTDGSLRRSSARPTAARTPVGAGR